jgi:hypothetical protein
MKLLIGIKRNYLLISFFLVLIFSFYIVLYAGEPVPGAEIYVELEPDDEPIVCCPGGTDPHGMYLLALPKPLINKIALRANPTSKAPAYKLNFYYRVKASTIKKMISNMPVSKNQSVTINIEYKIVYGAKQKTGKFSYTFNNVSEITDDAIKKTGPFTVILDNPNEKQIVISLTELPGGSKTGKNPL